MDSANDLVGIVNTIKELEETRNEFLCANQTLHDNIASLEAELEDMDNIRRQNQARIEEYEATLQCLEREHNNLTNAVQSKDAEIAELRGVYREMEDKARENQNLMQDLTATQHKMRKLKEYLQKLEEKLQEQEGNISKNEGLLKQLQQKLSDLRHTAETLEEENAIRSQCYEECRKHMEDAMMENDRLGEKLRGCELARQKLEDCVNKNQTYVKQLKNDLAMEQDDNRKLQAKIKVLEDELASNRKQLAGLRGDVDALQEELGDKHSELAECRDELKRRIAEFENYKNTITSLKQKILSNRSNVVTCPWETRSRTHRSKQRCGRSSEDRTKSETRNPYCTQRVSKPRAPSKKHKTGVTIC